MRLRSLALTSLVLAALSAPLACPQAPRTARATQVTTRAELIGGPRALGEVGDYLLENDKVRFIVQGEGFSRGFGVFGGGLLDADLVRTTSGNGDSEGGQGKDNFGEMFPAFFLEALDPHEVRDPDTGEKRAAIEVENDGGDGEPAVVVVRGTGGDFLAITQNLNEALLDEDRAAPNLYFEQRYILFPDAQYLTIQTKVQNYAFPPRVMEFNKWTFGGSGAIPSPFGDVVLFGAGNKVFLPHEAGFDLRYRLEDIYENGNYALPALPGLVSEYIASASEDVSYGIVPQGSARNYAYSVRDQFPGVTKHSLHVPFIASAFTGIFQVLPPNELAPNDNKPGGDDEFVFTRYFVVGSGDIASVTKVVLEDILHDDTGSIQGRLHERGTGMNLEKGSIIVYDEAGAKVTQCAVHEDGHFEATLRPGKYKLRAYVKGRTVTQGVGVEVKKGETAFPIVDVAAPATVVVTIIEGGVGPVPGKATLVAKAPASVAGVDSKNWLFDLSVGEPWRYTDFVADDASDDDTLRYIEDFEYAEDGVVRMTARPGDYQLVVGRGTEYTRFETDVTLTAGQTITVTAPLQRVVDTTGYIAADFHLHSRFSLDSDQELGERLLSYAGEGMEYAVSTDHNYVVDYHPMLANMGLERFINSAIGIELTTIDRGHFNGFPMERGDGALMTDTDGDGDFSDNAIASRTFGSFPWALRDPQDIFDDLRKRGAMGQDGEKLKVVVQVNHPRDSILGYFEQYAVDPETLLVHGQSGLVAPKLDAHPEFAPEKFSWDFDAIEVFNGKHYHFLHSYRVPAGQTFDPVACCTVTPGDVFRERPSQDCDDTIAGDCDCDLAKAQSRASAQECNEDLGIGFPGVIEDWFNILMTGKRVVGTANSDSHEPNKEEPGNPKSYVRVPVDVPSTVTRDDIVKAFAQGDVLMTNGPFLDVKVLGSGAAVGMGGTAKGASLTVNVQLRTTDWVKVDQLVVFVNGVEAARQDVPADAGRTHDAVFELDGIGDDGFLVVEASGTESMFPSVYPNEVPPLQFTDVLGSLGDSFGFGSDPNRLRPEVTSTTTPYALTNPIWIDADSDGEVTPQTTLPNVEAATAARRTVPAAPGFGALPAWSTQGAYVPTEDEVRTELERAAFEALPLRKQIELSRMPRWLWPSDDLRDVRRVLAQFARHNE